MRNILNLTIRELAAYFFSPLAYIITVAFLAAAGFFFYLLVRFTQDAGLTRELLGNFDFLTLIIAPLITMRLVAEEKRSGTYEMLMTAPVTEFQVALSKYIAAVCFYLFMLAPTLLYIYILARHGKPDYGMVTSGYVGVIMLACVYLAIGLLVSSLTSSQMVAGAVTLVILLLMWVIGWAGENARSEAFREVVAYLSFSRHLEAFGKGLIDTRDVVYYASVIVMCLFGTVRSLESRRWR